MSGSIQNGGVDDLYARLLRDFAGQIGEKTATYGHARSSVREEIVRCVWFGGHFSGSDLRTDDGRRIEVLSPGWWNVEGGPDFVRAEFLLEGEGRVVGDVEVHTVASGWYAHGHHRQPEYNDVALHVVMWSDGNGREVRTEGGQTVPQLTLSRAVEDDLEDLIEVVDPEEESPEADWPSVEGRFCGEAYRAGEITPEWLGRLLDAAGDHRMLSRAARAQELLLNHSPDQILYERIAEALGYKNNRLPFLQLAGLLPVDALRRAVPPDAAPREKARLLEAALFRTGGFLDGHETDGVDEETASYVAELMAAAERLAPDLAPARLPLGQWCLRGTRPVNYPGRRIAALAGLCARHLHRGLMSHFLRVVSTVQPGPRQRADRVLRSALIAVFTDLSHPYWSHHYSLGGKRLGEPRALVGAERATSILVDVLLPMLMAHAQKEADALLAEKVHALWRGVPRRNKNAVTRRMQQVMFPRSGDARKVVDSTRRQQGLHQLHSDFCRTDAGCQHCIVYLAHTAGRPLGFA